MRVSAAALLIELDGRAADHEKQHRLSGAGNLAIVKVYANDRISSKRCGLGLELIQSYFASVTQALLHRLATTAEGVSEQHRSVFEQMHAYHALSGHDAKSVGDGQIVGGFCGQDHPLCAKELNFGLLLL